MEPVVGEYLLTLYGIIVLSSRCGVITHTLGAGANSSLNARALQRFIPERKKFMMKLRAIEYRSEVLRRTYPRLVSREFRRWKPGLLHGIRPNPADGTPKLSIPGTIGAWKLSGILAISSSRALYDLWTLWRLRVSTGAELKRCWRRLQQSSHAIWWSNLYILNGRW